MPLFGFLKKTKGFPNGTPTQRKHLWPFGTVFFCYLLGTKQGNGRCRLGEILIRVNALEDVGGLCFVWKILLEKFVPFLEECLFFNHVLLSYVLDFFGVFISIMAGVV